MQQDETSEADSNTKIAALDKSVQEYLKKIIWIQNLVVFIISYMKF